MPTMTNTTTHAVIAAKLTTLRNAALDDWKAAGSAPVAAKARATAAWDGAILCASHGRFASAKLCLEPALTVAENEGAGFEEKRAIEIVEAAIGFDAADFAGPEAGRWSEKLEALLA